MTTDTAREGAHSDQDADQLRDAMVDEVIVSECRIWDRDHRHGPGPRLTVHPADIPDTELPSGLVIDQRHTRIVISWPDHAE